MMLRNKRDLVLYVNPATRIFEGIEKWCEKFNKFLLLAFWYFKYLFAFIFLICGILTLLRLRGIYKVHRAYSYYEKKGMIAPRYVVGVSYIVLAFGIFFNFLIYFLIFVLDPLPDRIIFEFIDFNGDIDPHYMNRIKDIEESKYAYERTIYYCIAFASFIGLVTIVICLYKIINKEKAQDMLPTVKTLIYAIIDEILVGFTTCLPFLL